MGKCAGASFSQDMKGECAMTRLPVNLPPERPAARGVWRGLALFVVAMLLVFLAALVVLDVLAS